ncbi:MAG: arsenate reductase ArsC [Rhodospirillaceae bacterium]|nr:arsenate reductase ArsC [Rhodospirillaceae bacterium]
MILPSSVLFCCTMNEIRSPMAEGIMKRFHGNQVFVDSVGVRPGSLDPLMVAAMSEIGVDMSRHRPKKFDNLADESFDMAIAVSTEAKHAAADLTRYMHCDLRLWNIVDPSMTEGSREARLAAYRQTRDQLQQKILELFPHSDHMGY